MFQVFDSGKPADSDHYCITKGLGWDVSKFKTLEAAQEYAVNYFWPYLGDPDGQKPILLEVGEPYSYQYESMAEIREVKE